MACDRAIPDRVPPPLAEGEHHRELKLTRGRRSVEVFRQGTELHSRMVQALDHQQPVGEPASGRAKVDRVGGKSPTFSCHPAPEVAPEQDGLRTSFWSALEWSMWMNRAGRVVSQTRVCDTGPQVTPFNLSRGGSQRYRAIRTSWKGNVPHQAFLPILRLLFLTVHLLFLPPLLGCKGGRSGLPAERSWVTWPPSGSSCGKAPCHRRGYVGKQPD